MPSRNRNPQPGGRQPSLRGLLIVDAVRGSLRIRAWPKKRPGPRHPTNEYWTAWLRAATFLYRYQPAQIQWQLQEATKGTVWMPRDIFIACLRGRAFLPTDEDGRKYYPMALLEEVSQSLDAIAQLPGDLLIRGEELWQALHIGTPGQILVVNPAGDAPAWADLASPSYTPVPLVTGVTTTTFFAINSTSYQFFPGLTFAWDWDEFTPTAVRYAISGGNNQAGQTVTAQIAQFGSLNTPITAAGNDFVISNVPTWHSTAWIPITAPKTGWREMCVALKGSNNTVDLGCSRFEVQFR